MNFATFSAILNAITASMTINEKLGDTLRSKLNAQQEYLRTHTNTTRTPRVYPFDRLSISDRMALQRERWRERMSGVQDVTP